MPSAVVIDDNRQTADGVCRMLNLLGVRARPAYGPREGLLLLRQSPPDIVFLDINLPGVDGFEVLAYLQREPIFKETPVVIITSDDQPETALKARRTGALLLIVKPVTMETLERVLRTQKLIP
ncbi:MAG: response regulator [Chloroflexi bacterium]|nr:response regulator [Chloroflexota bacterium]